MDLPLICDWPNRPKQKVCYETGKAAQTEYEVVEFATDNTARVVLKPITGRSHQLRVHMLALGHPILGDRFYAAGSHGVSATPAAACRDAHHYSSRVWQ